MSRLSLPLLAALLAVHAGQGQCHASQQHMAFCPPIRGNHMGALNKNSGCDLPSSITSLQPPARGNVERQMVATGWDKEQSEGGVAERKSKTQRLQELLENVMDSMDYRMVSDARRRATVKNEKRRPERPQLAVRQPGPKTLRLTRTLKAQALQGIITRIINMAVPGANLVSPTGQDVIKFGPGLYDSSLAPDDVAVATVEGHGIVATGPRSTKTIIGNTEVDLRDILADVRGALDDARWWAVQMGGVEGAKLQDEVERLEKAWLQVADSWHREVKGLENGQRQGRELMDSAVALRRDVNALVELSRRIWADETLHLVGEARREASVERKQRHLEGSAPTIGWGEERDREKEIEGQAQEQRIKKEEETRMAEMQQEQEQLAKTMAERKAKIEREVNEAALWAIARQRDQQMELQREAEAMRAMEEEKKKQHEETKEKEKRWLDEAEKEKRDAVAAEAKRQEELHTLALAQEEMARQREEERQKAKAAAKALWEQQGRAAREALLKAEEQAVKARYPERVDELSESERLAVENLQRAEREEERIRQAEKKQAEVAERRRLRLEAEARVLEQMAEAKRLGVDGNNDARDQLLIEAESRAAEDLVRTMRERERAEAEVAEAERVLAAARRAFEVAVVRISEGPQDDSEEHLDLMAEARVAQEVFQTETMRAEVKRADAQDALRIENIARAALEFAQAVLVHTRKEHGEASHPWENEAPTAQEAIVEDLARTESEVEKSEQAKAEAIAAQALSEAQQQIAAEEAAAAAARMREEELAEAERSRAAQEQAEIELERQRLQEEQLQQILAEQGAQEELDRRVKEEGSAAPQASFERELAEANAAIQRATEAAALAYKERTSWAKQVSSTSLSVAVQDRVSHTSMVLLRVREIESEAERDMARAETILATLQADLLVQTNEQRAVSSAAAKLLAPKDMANEGDVQRIVEWQAGSQFAGDLSGMLFEGSSSPSVQISSGSSESQELEGKVIGSIVDAQPTSVPPKTTTSGISALKNFVNKAADRLQSSILTKPSSGSAYPVQQQGPSGKSEQEDKQQQQQLSKAELDHLAWQERMHVRVTTASEVSSNIVAFLHKSKAWNDEEGDMGDMVDQHAAEHALAIEYFNGWFTAHRDRETFDAFGDMRAKYEAVVHARVEREKADRAIMQAATKLRLEAADQMGLRMRKIKEAADREHVEMLKLQEEEQRQAAESLESILESTAWIEKDSEQEKEEMKAKAALLWGERAIERARQDRQKQEELRLEEASKARQKHEKQEQVKHEEEEMARIVARAEREQEERCREAEAMLNRSREGAKLIQQGLIKQAVAAWRNARAVELLAKRAMLRKQRANMREEARLKAVEAERAARDVKMQTLLSAEVDVGKEARRVKAVEQASERIKAILARKEAEEGALRSKEGPTLALQNDSLLAQDPSVQVKEYEEVLRDEQMRLRLEHEPAAREEEVRMQQFAVGQKLQQEVTAERAEEEVMEMHDREADAVQKQEDEELRTQALLALREDWIAQEKVRVEREAAEKVETDAFVAVQDLCNKLNMEEENMERIYMQKLEAKTAQKLREQEEEAQHEVQEWRLDQERFEQHYDDQAVPRSEDEAGIVHAETAVALENAEVETVKHLHKGSELAQANMEFRTNLAAEARLRMKEFNKYVNHRVHHGNDVCDKFRAVKMATDRMDLHRRLSEDTRSVMLHDQRGGAAEALCAHYNEEAAAIDEEENAVISELTMLWHAEDNEAHFSEYSQDDFDEMARYASDAEAGWQGDNWDFSPMPQSKLSQPSTPVRQGDDDEEYWYRVVLESLFSANQKAARGVDASTDRGHGIDEEVWIQEFSQSLEKKRSSATLFRPQQ